VSVRRIEGVFLPPKEENLFTSRGEKLTRENQPQKRESSFFETGEIKSQAGGGERFVRSKQRR